MNMMRFFLGLGVAATVVRPVLAEAPAVLPSTAAVQSAAAVPAKAPVIPAARPAAKNRAPRPQRKEPTFKQALNIQPAPGPWPVAPSKPIPQARLAAPARHSAYQTMASSWTVTPRESGGICLEEIQKYCQTAQRGSLSVGACLDGNAAQLSESCRAARVQARERIRQLKTGH